VNWGELFVYLVTATGWTFEEVEALTLPRLAELNKLWDKVPPDFVSLNEIRLMLRSYFGVKESSGESTGEPNNSDNGDLIGDLLAAGFVMT